MEERAPRWVVYLLESLAPRPRGQQARSYVGITTELERRVAQHNGEQPGGARSTRAARPWKVARTLGPYETRACAQRVESALKAARGLSARMSLPAPECQCESGAHPAP